MTTITDHTIDIDDVEDRLEELRVEERVTG